MKTRHTVAIATAILVAGVLFPAAAGAQDERVRRGFDAYRQGSLTEAEAVFREVCAEHEKAGAPWGWCHMILGAVLGHPGQDASKRQEALAQLEIARDLVTTDAERFETFSSIANIHLLGHDWGAAVAAADDAEPFAADGQGVVLAKIRGQAYYRSRDYVNAVPELEVAARARPGEANLRALLGHSYLEVGERDAALAELTEAARLDEDNLIALFFAARIHVENGNYTTAVALAERAHSVNPQDIGIRTLLGSAYLGADRYAEAVEQFETVIDERPDDATAIYNLGQAYSATENWEKAIELFERARELWPEGRPGQGALLYDLGFAFEKLLRHEQALGAYLDSVAIADSLEKQDAIDRVREHIRRGQRKGGPQGR